MQQSDAETRVSAQQAADEEPIRKAEARQYTQQDANGEQQTAGAGAMRQAGPPVAARASLCTSTFLSIREAAQRLSVSPRSVYGYIEHGKLPMEIIDGMRMVPASAVACFERRPPGRAYQAAPAWHQPPEQNALTLTTIMVRMYPEQQEVLEAKLTEMRQQNTHCLPGTSARYIMQDRDDPGKVRLVLVWRSYAVPPAEESEAALEALYTDLADVLDWSTAMIEEGVALLHA